MTKKEKSKENERLPSFWSLLRYSTILDKLLMLCGTIAALAHGTGMPLLFVLFGTITTEFVNYGTLVECDFDYEKCSAFGYNLLVNEGGWDAYLEEQTEKFRENSIWIVYVNIYVAGAVFVAAAVATFCWVYAATRQVNKIRLNFFRSVLRQDGVFHDLNTSGEINVRFASDINKIKAGIGDKIANLLQYISMGITGIIVGFFYAWKLALVTIAVAPLIGISSGLYVVALTQFSAREINAYAKAGSVAEETIAAHKTVAAFGIQQTMVERFCGSLDSARREGLRKGFCTGLSTGFLYFVMYSTYALSFWYGIKLVFDGEIEAGDMLTTFFGIIIAAFALGTCGTFWAAVSEAKAASIKIFEVIDRTPTIDIFSPLGDEPHRDNTQVVFQDVRFHYPARPDIEVLKGVSFTVPHGSRVALVGASGCGKSTIIKLVQRFYDPESGNIEIGGKSVKGLNLKKYRDLIGVVSQEPVLFETSIAENIRWGRDNVSDKEMVQAAAKANAFDFIMKMPERFDTFVGEGGSQMSGGQKQRIAIARAIVRNPKILLLDEATSALDTKSESIVQAALDKASEGRTTIVVAHRLSTVRNADLIIAFSDGRVIEQGTHDELMSLDGVYANLCHTQNENKEKSASHSFESDDHQNASVLALQLGKNTGSDDKDEDEEPEEDLPEVSTCRLIKMNRPEWFIMLLGLLFCLVAGSCDPFLGIVFSEILTVFTVADEDERNREVAFYCSLFVIIGTTAFVAFSSEAILFSKAGVELTTRIRRQTFQSILRQDASFFDEPLHTTSILCARLASDANKVQGMTGAKLGLVLKNFASLGVGLGIGFWYSWKLTLIMLGFIPLMILGGILEMALVMGDEQSSTVDNSAAGQIASEAINNVGTVAAMTREQAVYEKYRKAHKEAAGVVFVKPLVLGIGYGYSQCILFFVFAAIFRYGTELIIDQENTFDEVFKVLMAILFGAMAVAQNSSFAPDFAEAKVAAARIFQLLDRVPLIDAYSLSGLTPDRCKGEVKVASAKFHYPTRPDAPVLKDLSIKADPGESVALVGHSGCGKSTIIQLLQRFYDPVDGQVYLDGIDIRKLNISWLRQQLGIVSQEPVLFNITLKENILYGDIDRAISDDEIIKAAKLANAHNFISSLPQGYDTMAGQKGSQLSGGQKQRIAIARALLRYPKVLLLDEATSALDNESEKIVQAALDDARVGRTCLMVSHRLSTVKNADQIYVVDNGEVVESGVHDELIGAQGAYFGLVNAQLAGESG